MLSIEVSDLFRQLKAVHHGHANVCQDQAIYDGKNKSVNYFKKIITPTENEIKKNEKYLKNNLKKNYFN